MYVTLISGDSDDEVEDKSLQKLAVALGAKEKKKKVGFIFGLSGFWHVSHCYWHVSDNDTATMVAGL